MAVIESGSFVQKFKRLFETKTVSEKKEKMMKTRNWWDDTDQCFAACINENSVAKSRKSFFSVVHQTLLTYTHDIIMTI